MVLYKRVLIDSIEKEKAGLEYICPQEDKALFRALLEEINAATGTNLRYLAELDMLETPGAGPVIAQYITGFSSESIKAFLVPKLVSDRVKDCDKLILQLYHGYKGSDLYVPSPAKPSPAHIYVRYDNAFRKLKPKRLKKDLLDLVHNHRDAYYLPFTTRMLASWKIPEMYDLLLTFLCDSNITQQSVCGVIDASSLQYIRRDLCFTALDGLKYFPSEKTCSIIESYTTNPDADICALAKKTLRFLLKSV